MFKKTWFLALALVVGGTTPTVAQDDTAQVKEPPCSSPEYGQFDFWIGTWDLTWGDGDNAGTGSNVISRELDGCVIEENFTSHGDNPFVGNSLSVYDAAAGIWKQTWVDNAGGYLDFTGGMVGDSMILSRDAVREGEPVKQRMVFHSIAADSLVWDWQSSSDDGQTWKLLWRIKYQRAR